MTGAKVIGACLKAELVDAGVTAVELAERMEMNNIEIILSLVFLAGILYVYGRLEYHRGYLDGITEAIDILKEKLEEIRDD